MSYQITAFDLKLALMGYFRFERQWICVDEFRGADVIVDTGKDIIEVEVKISKGDLVNGEAKKYRKHNYYRTGRGLPNKFYFCVPEALVESAIAICEKFNSDYGVVAFNASVFEQHLQWKWNQPHRGCLRMAKTAKRLHKSPASCRKAIAMRASSKVITLMETEFKRGFFREE